MAEGLEESGMASPDQVWLEAHRRESDVGPTLRNDRVRVLEEQVMALSEELKIVYTELKDAQLRMYAHERLACLGEMTTGIAHEINNPLTYVMFNLSSLESELQALSECVDNSGSVTSDAVQLELKDTIAQCNTIVHDSVDGIERIREIVRNLKEFAYGQTPILEHFDISRNIEMSLKLAWNEIRHKVDVVKRFGETPRLLGYPKQMNQVFINLFVNAAQAISGHGELRIETEVKDGYVWVHVSDTGGGIPQAIQDRIFDSFFTTKPSGEGTGLGLGVVREIVKRHYGKLTFSSEEGKGTRFSIGLLIENPQLETLLAKQKKEKGYV